MISFDTTLGTILVYSRHGNQARKFRVGASVGWNGEFKLAIEFCKMHILHKVPHRSRFRLITPLMSYKIEKFRDFMVFDQT